MCGGFSTVRAEEDETVRSITKYSRHRAALLAYMFLHSEERLYEEQNKAATAEAERQGSPAAGSGSEVRADAVGSQVQPNVSCPVSQWNARSALRQCWPGRTDHIAFPGSLQSQQHHTHTEPRVATRHACKSPRRLPVAGFESPLELLAVLRRRRVYAPRSS